MGNKNQTTNGDLRTPVVFFSAQIDEGLDGRDTSFEKVFMAFAEVYSPSSKDIQIADSVNAKASFTIKIRDPLTAYIPDNKHFVEIKDNRYQGQKWPIIDVRPTFDERYFITIVLGGVVDD